MRLFEHALSTGLNLGCRPVVGCKSRRALGDPSRNPVVALCNLLCVRELGPGKDDLNAAYGVSTPLEDDAGLSAVR
jgi:hypothetical protein